MIKFICLSLLCVALVYCGTRDGIEFFSKLKKNPKQLADQGIPKKILSNHDNSVLKNIDKLSPEFQKFNDKWRKSFSLGRPEKRGDTPADFFEGESFESNLKSLPLSGEARYKPWSTTYWPIRHGVLSVRYGKNDKNSDSGTYKESISKYSEPEDFEAAKNSGNVDEYVAKYFSPAEKYDLLVGDTSFTLTNENKQEGESLMEGGDVASWMGICHGWAPAAIFVNRPVNDVTLTAADGKTKVKFYAHDVRGLASLLWASSPYNSINVGSRCNTKLEDVPKDPESGLLTDYTCFDVNPATWTIIVANKLGKQKKSFVIDATLDYEVWNQPVYKYSMKYFNVLNENESCDGEACKVNVKDLENSNNAVMKFVRKMTSKSASHVIGVSMSLVYIAEIRPTQGAPADDAEIEVNYVYTLELDESGEIIGGEWLVNKHPDFVWTAGSNSSPQSEEDGSVGNIDVSSADSLRSATKYAASASGKGRVLSAIIDGLVGMSSVRSFLELE